MSFSERAKQIMRDYVERNNWPKKRYKKKKASRLETVIIENLDNNRSETDN